MIAPLDISKANDHQKAEMLKYAAETRRFEIERFWQRSLFFWGFIAASFVAYFAVSAMDKPPPTLLLIIACFGTVSSVAWTLLNRGSKYWQVAWENKVKLLEQDVLGAPLFSNIEPYQKGGFWGPARYSTSKLATALSDFTTLVWVALAIAAFPVGTIPKSLILPGVVVAVTALYVVSLFVAGRSGQSSN